MLRFVGGIGHDEIKRLYMYRQFASSTTFQRFANGRKDSYRNAASEIYSEFIDVEGYEVDVSLYFVKRELMLVLSCYACMH